MKGKDTFSHVCGCSHSYLAVCTVHLPSNSAFAKWQSELWWVFHIEKHLISSIKKKTEKTPALMFGNVWDHGSHLSWQG